LEIKKQGFFNRTEFSFIENVTVAAVYADKPFISKMLFWIKA
jgi:hypothetical protein